MDQNIPCRRGKPKATLKPTQKCLIRFCDLDSKSTERELCEKVGQGLSLVERTDKRAESASLGGKVDDLRVLVGIDGVDGQVGASRVDFLYSQETRAK